MRVQGLTPILNVSDMEASFAWFAKLGWHERWRWGEPTSFGASSSGKAEIFLCRDGQGGRGKGSNTGTFGAPAGEQADKGCWMSWWVEDVDACHAECREARPVFRACAGTLYPSCSASPMRSPSGPRM
ncbi:MAG: bleomycin resistance family protein [Gemmatimonadales bacterium]